MAINPSKRPDATHACRLVPFERAWAQLVISWVTDAREAYWLAPKTAPPLTPAHVLRWQEPGHVPFALVPGPGREPIGYGELNRFEHPRRHYWLGHLIVSPTWRGRGCGVALTRLLLAEAFQERGARRVTLVVFRENQPAWACYRAAGLHDDGFEWHSFPAYGTREYLVRLAANAG